MERAKIKKAAAFVDNVLAQRGGSDLMYIGGIYYALTQVELENELSQEELLKLTERVAEACGASTVPLLTAERCDAVRYMLEYGVSGNMSPELYEMSPERAREVLLNCDMDIFTDLVDSVAVDAHDYYAPDNNFMKEEDFSRVNTVLERFDKENGLVEIDKKKSVFCVSKEICDGIVDAALRTIRGVGVDMGSGCYDLNSFEIDGEKLNLYADVCKVQDGDGLHYAVYYAVEYVDGDNLFHDWAHTETLDVDALKEVVCEIANTDFTEDILKELHKGRVDSLEQKVLAAACATPHEKSQGDAPRETEDNLAR